MKLLSTIEAARLLNVSPDTVRYLARRGQLPAEQYGPRGTRIFRLEDVEKLARDRGVHDDVERVTPHRKKNRRRRSGSLPAKREPARDAT